MESPLDGVVRSTNHQLAGQPHLLGTQPMDEGWLFELEADAPGVEGANLMGPQAADKIYEEDRLKFVSSLEHAVSGGHKSVGITLADGGQRLQSMADMLGAAKYFSLLRKALS